MPIYLKYIITAALVVITSEIANKNEKIGALVGALPVMTIIVILWIFTENKASEGADKIASYVYYTFWYVLPTLPMLIVMSQMLKKGGSVWLSLGVYVVGTIALFFLLNLVLKRFSIHLM
ncbi:MAG: DUF3147 family protein [Akkermansiaceae bacterium]